MLRLWWWVRHGSQGVGVETIKAQSGFKTQQEITKKFLQMYNLKKRQFISMKDKYKKGISINKERKKKERKRLKKGTKQKTNQVNNLNNKTLQKEVVG